MKNFMKKFAFVLAFAMVLTSLTPAAGASAAASDSDMEINLSSKILYIGESDISGTKDEYDFYIKNKPSNYNSLYKFEWTSSDTDVATVNGSGLTKAVTTGTTTIRCRITDKKTGEVVSNTTSKVTVKTNASAVSIYNYPEDRTAEVGEVIDFNRRMTPKTGVGTATDKTRWVLSDNTAGATVTQSNGKVTATRAGSYTITAYTYQSSSYPLELDEEGNYTNYTAVSSPVTITVVDETPDPTPTPTPTPAAPEIRQISSTSFRITFSEDMRNTINRNNLTVRDQRGLNQIINTLTFSEEGTVVDVVLYNTLVNSSTYTITYGTTTLTLTTSTGEVSAIQITGIQNTINRVAPGEAGTIQYTVYDSNGVAVSMPSTAYVTFEILNDNYNAIIYNNQISMWQVNTTATIVATYHTNNYTQNGTEIVYQSAPFTVYCVESVAPTVSTITASTIASTNVGSSVNFTNPVTRISLSDNGNLYLVVKAVDTAGNTVYLTEFSSADASRLIIEESTGRLYPVATGQTNILCYSNGNVVGVVPITVTDYRRAQTLSLSRTSITLSNSDRISDSASVTVTLRDQYGDEMDVDSLTVTKLNNNLPELIVNTDGNTVTFYGSGATAGTYTYRITAGNVSQVVTVVVRSAGSITSYRLTSDVTTMDMKITSSTASSRYVTISLNGYDSSGVKVNAESGVTITLRKPDGTTETYKTDSNGQFRIPVVENGVKLLRVGAYQAYTNDRIDNRAVAPATFSITDTQPRPNVGLSVTRLEAYVGTDIYSEIISKCIIATSNSGADSISVSIDNSCVITTNAFQNGICMETGTHNLAIRQVYVTETFGTNTVETTVTLPTAQTLTVVVR